MKDLVAPEEGTGVSLEEIVNVPNIADMLPEEEISRIGELAISEYEIDCESMKPWKERMQRGLDLAALVKKDKTYPWPNAANIKYPLVTTAALMFNAKAYPAVVPSDQVVQAKVWGADPNGAKAARAERVAQHMSWQLLCEVEEWEEETDKLLTLLPIVGTVVRKVWYDIAQGRIRCRIITPGAFVINDKVKALIDAPRLSEELSLYPAEIKERRMSGEWRDIDYIEADGEDTEAAQEFVEQHRRLDLDGDGYSEPYVVTVHKLTRKVARIVADFEMGDVKRAETITGPDGKTVQVGKITAIKRGAYFVPYHFLPSMDGGFLGTGFGLLLGDISETINSIMNLMLDAGHSASLGGGFIGSDFRIKGGAQRMKPGEWRLANATGATIKDSIVPLTYPGADSTLFELLGLLIEAGKEVASIKDVLTGETGGKTMTATTTLALIEQGMAQFTAAYKRIFRSLKQEFRLIAGINAKTVTPEAYNRFHDDVEEAGPQGMMPPQPGQPPQEGMAPGADPAMMQPGAGPAGAPPMPGAMSSPQPKMYDPRTEYDMSDMDISPVADPQSVTRMQEAAKAQVVMQMAEAGMVDPAEAAKRVLESAAIANVEELLPKPNPMQEALMAAEIAEKQAKAQEGQLKAQELQVTAQTAMATAQQAEREGQMRMAEFTAEMQFKQAEMQNNVRETDAKVELTMAQVQLVLAQIQEIGAKIEQGNADIALKAKATAITEATAQADIAYRGEEVGIAKRGAEREDFKTQKDVEHKGAELGLKSREVETSTEIAKRAAARDDFKAKADVSHKDSEIGIKDREVKQRGAALKATSKAKP